jgi:hypothetical protein
VIGFGDLAQLELLELVHSTSKYDMMSLRQAFSRLMPTSDMMPGFDAASVIIPMTSSSRLTRHPSAASAIHFWARQGSAP